MDKKDEGKFAPLELLSRRAGIRENRTTSSMAAGGMAHTSSLRGGTELQYSPSKREIFSSSETAGPLQAVGHLCVQKQRQQAGIYTIAVTLRHLHRVAFPALGEDAAVVDALLLQHLFA
ncbi:hypothetical protein, partial [Salinibacter sp.]|uniref:hypothetical protein n=1 Tax=Salinibacter sp. TaxID=2065818 RepID=UPI0021E946F2